MKTVLRFFLLALALLLVVAFWVNVQSYRHSGEHFMVNRARLAASSTGAIQIAVVWPNISDSLFVRGVDLAIKRINTAGGVRIELNDGSTVRRRIGACKFKEYLHGDARETAKCARRTAREIVSNVDIVAVIGHCSSGTAVPASIADEHNGLLFMAPVATDPVLTGHRFSYVFRNIPSDTDFAETLAVNAYGYGVRTVAVLYVRSPYGENFMESFMARAADVGISSSLLRSYPAVGYDFSAVAAEARHSDFDAVILADGVPRAAHLIRRLRQMGVSESVLGSDGLDEPELLEIAGDAANKTFVATVFDSDLMSEPGNSAAGFIKEFIAEYGTSPNLPAAQGYEAVSILAQAFEKCNSIVPVDVATVLRHGGDWQGVTGPCSFDEHGSIVGRDVRVKMVHDRQFHWVILTGDEDGSGTNTQEAVGTDAAVQAASP